MFGHKKNKKQENMYSGSYVVKDVDNIISIAQSYDVPWKELAKVNDIDPPYILISGEVINVPGEEVVTDEQDGALVSDVKNFKQTKKQSSMEEVQVQKTGEGNMKPDTQAAHKSVTMPVDKKLAQQGTVTRDAKKKVRKVTYASPKSMLHKPSAEPTTQSIDIEWMRDDEATYSEETQLQRKRLNTRFIVVSILIVGIMGLVVWWGATWFLGRGDNENISVQSLIEENRDEAVDVSEEIVSEEVNEKVGDDKDENNDSIIKNEEVKDAKDESEQKKEDDKNEQVKESSSSVAEITVQVLNAGAQVGAAGDVTNIFAKNGYKTVEAQNANNDYKDVVIYYSSNKKNALSDVAKEVAKKYGTQKHEESDEVTKKYGADFVVVLGS